MTQPKLNCIHHWSVNQQNVGTCIKCGDIRDFAAIQNKKQHDIAEAKATTAIQRKEAKHNS